MALRDIPKNSTSNCYFPAERTTGTPYVHTVRYRSELTQKYTFTYTLTQTLRTLTHKHAHKHNTHTYAHKHKTHTFTCSQTLTRPQTQTYTHTHTVAPLCTTDNSVLFSCLHPEVNNKWRVLKLLL